MKHLKFYGVVPTVFIHTADHVQCTVEPWYNKVPKDWGNDVIKRVIAGFFSIHFSTTRLNNVVHFMKVLGVPMYQQIYVSLANPHPPKDCRTPTPQIFCWLHLEKKKYMRD